MPAGSHNEERWVPCPDHGWDELWPIETFRRKLVVPVRSPATDDAARPA
ncbi:MAG TPA: hypothetical protein VFW16_07785 [Streptosporangiaceae bacterium]|nr:hypothetical protein [Streptosporangiaceae bacterium]